MGENTYLLLCLAFATKFMIAHAQNSTGCIYEGQRFKADRQGQLPLETHYDCLLESYCKEICEFNPTCIIWQWQPTRKICWIMNVEPSLDKNSDFGINNCNEGQPKETAPQCQVTKGDRNNVWEDYRDMTREDCVSKCDDDSDCLIWQHIKNRKLCRIHKLEVDLSKKSHVGIHYCKTDLSCSLQNRAGPGVMERQMWHCHMADCYPPNCPDDLFKKKHLCINCPTKYEAMDFCSERVNMPLKHFAPTNTVIATEGQIEYGCQEVMYRGNRATACTGKAKAMIYNCQLVHKKPGATSCDLHPYFNYRYEKCFFQHLISGRWFPKYHGHLLRIVCIFDGFGGEYEIYRARNF